MLHGFQQALVVPNLDSAVFVPDTINGMNRWAQISVVVAGYGAAIAAAAPTRAARRKLLVAVGIEVVIGACAVVHWFVPAPPF